MLTLLLGLAALTAAAPGCAGQGDRGGTVPGKSRAVSGTCRFPAFPLLGLPRPLQAAWGRGNICMANTSFAGKKKIKKFAGGAVGSTVQERTSQGLLQQQLGSLRAET